LERIQLHIQAKLTSDYSNLSLFNLLAINQCFGDLEELFKKDMLAGDNNGICTFSKPGGTAVLHFRPAMNHS